MNIETSDQCLKQFNDLKFRKIQARYIIYAIKEQKIIIEKVGEKAQNWQNFLQSLPDNQYRYCVFDFEFKNEDNMAISKVIFVNWCSDNAPIKNRVVYATAKEGFKKYLDLNTKDYTLGSKTDYTEKDMIKEMSK